MPRSDQRLVGPTNQIFVGYLCFVKQYWLQDEVEGELWSRWGETTASFTNTDDVAIDCVEMLRFGDTCARNQRK